MSKCKLCKEDMPKGRAELGYITCLECGEMAAQILASKRRKQVAPAYNKGAYQFITVNDLETIGR